MLCPGDSWKINKSVVELWYHPIFDSDSAKSTFSGLDEDKLTASVNIEPRVECDEQATSDSEMDEVKPDEKFLGNVSDEDDSLLIIYQETISGCQM